MAKRDKKAWKAANERYLADVAREEGVKALTKDVLYEVLEGGEGKQPRPPDVVSVYYRGWLIDGKVFDDNTALGYPDAFRLSELIEGWQIALTQMHEGDKWRIYVPAASGYGSRGDSDIPGNSTLVFDIQLVKVN